MTDAIEVRFKGRRLQYFVNPDRVPVASGDQVIVEAERGFDMGEVVHLAVPVDRADRDASLLAIVRRAADDDFKDQERAREREGSALKQCRDEVRRLGLDMKVVDAEVQFDGNRLTFFFTADQRVDFRELVRALASIFKTRIELRQIGARDAAKRIGGIGPCGREYCCSTWLKTFKPVTLKMAKNQGLALAPSKISGGCGRLMCCLMYEDPFYKEMSRVFPKPGKVLSVDGHSMRVVGNDFFREVVKLRDKEGELVEFHLDEFPVDRQEWGGAERAAGAPKRGGHHGCGKVDPKPTGMLHAKGRAGDDEAIEETKPQKKRIPIAKADEGPKGAPFMHGGKKKAAPPADGGECEPAALIRYKASERRKEDGDELGSGTDEIDLGESDLVASADPETDAKIDSKTDSETTPSKRRRRRRRRRGGKLPDGPPRPDSPAS